VLIEYDRKIGISIFDLIRIQKFLKRITKKEIDICTKKQILKRSFGKKAVEEAYFL
jgi:predicted nucleotidyltransferase